MNAWYSRVDKPDRPDFVLFDLDPPDGAGRLPAGGARRAPDPRRARGARARLVREDERRRRDPRAAADRAALRLRRDLRVRRAARRGGSRREHPGEVTTEWLKKKRVGRARRPPPERAREDDRVGLLGAAEAGRAGLDAAALGGADRGHPPARLLDGGRARAGRRGSATCSSRCSAAGRRSGRRCARYAVRRRDRGTGLARSGPPRRARPRGRPARTPAGTDRR